MKARKELRFSGSSMLNTLFAILLLLSLFNLRSDMKGGCAEVLWLMLGWRSEGTLGRDDVRINSHKDG
jgi:hypothetical protein